MSPYECHVYRCFVAWAGRRVGCKCYSLSVLRLAGEMCAAVKRDHTVFSSRTCRYSLVPGVCVLRRFSGAPHQLGGRCALFVHVAIVLARVAGVPRIHAAVVLALMYDSTQHFNRNMQCRVYVYMLQVMKVMEQGHVCQLTTRLQV